MVDDLLINVPLGLGSLALLLPKMARSVFHRGAIDWLAAAADGPPPSFSCWCDRGGNRYPGCPHHHGDDWRQSLALAFVWHARKAEGLSAVALMAEPSPALRDAAGGAHWAPCWA
jgi:hypothetical protein